MKFDWKSEVGQEIQDLRSKRKTFKEIQSYLYAKYGKEVTVARLSQVFKKFREVNNQNAN